MLTVDQFHSEVVKTLWLTAILIVLLTVWLLGVSTQHDQQTRKVQQLEQRVQQLEDNCANR